MRPFHCALIAFASALLLRGEGNFYVRDNDLVVFYGDSITDQRLYTVITESYILTRYPKLNATFIHSGWGGDKVSGGAGGPIDARLQRDVLVYRPTIVTIMLGMNDGGYKPQSPDKDQAYFKGYENIVNTIRAALPTIRITAILPSPYDDVTRPPLFPGGYNAVLLNFSRWISNYAQTNHLTVADFNLPTVEMLRKANAENTAEAQKILPDRVHPGMAGHLIMAEQLLKAWNGRSVVATVSIDASQGKPKLLGSVYTRVSDLTSANGISWTELDESLPLPFAQWRTGRDTAPVTLAIHNSDVAEALNQETVKVVGLPEGKYRLQIDDVPVATLTNTELAQGTNLALLDTPMSQQSEEVYNLTISHSTIHNDRWRTIQVPLQRYELPEEKPAIDSLDRLEHAVVVKQREAAQPKPHTFRLIPVA